MNEELTPLNDPPQQGNALLSDLRQIIRSGKSQAVAAVNSALTLTYWHVGKRINAEVLQGERAAYGEQVIALVAQRLVEQFGKGFEAKNLRRMMKFAEIFHDSSIVAPVARQLSWSHFLILIPLKTLEARLFYARQSIEHLWSKRELTRQIERKAFERAEIADSKLELAAAPELAGAFKDPYFFEFLGLPDGYLENDLEQALIRELEQFILELGKGFAFVERQKRMIIDGEDFYLDLLFYHRRLKRLVAVELKIDRFKADRRLMSAFSKKSNFEHTNDHQVMGEKLPDSHSITNSSSTWEQEEPADTSSCMRATPQKFNLLLQRDKELGETDRCL